MFLFRLVIYEPLEKIGQFFKLLFQAFLTLGDIRSYRKNLITQMVSIGVDSMPIIALAAAFAGMVSTVQTAYQLTSPLVPKTIIGAIVVPSMILELAAVVTGFILAGRVGARIAAELGTMRVTEQIDALEAMGLNSTGYLIVPRVLAGILMFPCMYVVASFAGIASGAGVGHLVGIISFSEFMEGARLYFNPFDPFFGVIKSLVFGFTITSVSCYVGYNTLGGAEGVGRSTTQAAVASCVFLLIVDLVLAVTLL